MRKKMLFLASALAALAASLQAPRAEAAGGHNCVQCTTLSDGSQCCVTCWCSSNGWMACPAIGCGEIEP